MSFEYKRSFQAGYIEAMKFTDLGPDDECSDLDLATPEEDILNAISGTFYMLTEVATDKLCDLHGAARMGQYLWYASNGHGVSLTDDDSTAAAELWDKMAQKVPQVDVYGSGQDESEDPASSKATLGPYLAVH